MMKKYLIIIIAAAYLTSSCSEDNVASNTNFQVIPETPVLIQSDFSFTRPPVTPDAEPEIVTISGAWFKLGYKFTNFSSKEVTIVSIKFEATGKSPSGADITSESTFDPSDLYVNQNAVDNDDRLYLFSALPNTEASLDGGTTTANVYLHGFPKIPAVMNSSLRVKGTLEGWVGSPTAPEESFQKIFFFSTQ